MNSIYELEQVNLPLSTHPSALWPLVLITTAHNDEACAEMHFRAPGPGQPGTPLPYRISVSGDKLAHLMSCRRQRLQNTSAVRRIGLVRVTQLPLNDEPGTPLMVPQCSSIISNYTTTY